VNENPVLGVFFHWLGGLAAGSFYVPYRGVKGWAWETYWLAGGFFSWIIAPWILALLLVPEPVAILQQARASCLFWTYFFGVLWGIGGLTFGLSVRYLGMSLGYAIALGFCSACGALIPPIFKGTLGAIASSIDGKVVLGSIPVCLLGIAVTGLAGMSKEKELTDEQKKSSVKEFSFFKGVAVAAFAGVMSACMSFGFTAGQPIADAAKAQLLQHGRMDLWQNLPVLIVVMMGGFTTNFIWCVFLNLKNKTGGQYIGGAAAPSDTMPAVTPPAATLALNYLFCALAGITWYMQFFFYGMGQTRMGSYDYASWTLHMASIIIFSTLWGIGLKEWKDASGRTRTLMALGLVVLIVSTLIAGYGYYLKPK
jgi:L-rhamnose-H+ transport protein